MDVILPTQLNYGSTFSGASSPKRGQGTRKRCFLAGRRPVRPRHLAPETLPYATAVVRLHGVKSVNHTLEEET